MKASDNLEAGAKTFKQRNELYGDNYLDFGPIMKAMFPKGIPVHSAEDWNRIGIFVQCVSKLTRYAQNLTDGGHLDSAHDLMVYAAMLEEVTDGE